MKYDMERLGPFGFQDLCAALALKVFGAGVRPMGRGKDGGRDLLTRDPVRWSGDTIWAGVTVFQVKQKERLSARPQTDASWLRGQIRDELESWSSPASGRARVPDQLVFVTNVQLAPAPGGGFDALTSTIDEWLAALRDESAEDHLDEPEASAARRERRARRDRMESLREWRIIDRTHLNGWLDSFPEVRRAFDGFLTAGDVLADLARFATALSEDELGPALKEHARWALTNERDIYFDEAGAEPKGFPVDQVVIDLPVNVDGSETTERVIRYVLDRGDRVLRPSMATLDKPRHLVIVGAPGNGKSTVSKFLVHAYRAALLAEESDLGDEHQRTVKSTVEALESVGRNRPASRRWPHRIDLARFATEKATDPNYTLLSFIAETLSKQVAALPVPKSVLASWLKVWPTLLVLDGLDEVTEPTVRKGVVAEIAAFVSDAETRDYDTLVIVTTRPSGYADEMSPSMFERLDLADLPLPDALHYGRRVTQVRLPSDEPRRAGIVALLEEAAGQESLRRLLRTPLQVLIMSIIAESSKGFAPSRYKLFHGYYQTVEQRERSKVLGYSALLRDHSTEVLDLHRRVGFLLQQRAETATGSESVLTYEELRDAAWNVLKDAGYDPSASDAGLLTKIVTAATHRLVLLTPQPGGGFGFDVRSLQELMAALALTTGSLEEAIPRLRRIAASPHWRNTFLFAAGRFFAEPQPHQKSAITELVVGIDRDAPDRLAEYVPIGPQLALEVVDDGMASEPVYLHPLLEHALTLLLGPEPTDITGFVRFIMAASATSESSRAIVVEGMRAALGAHETARKTTRTVQDHIQHHPRDEEVDPHVLSLAAVRRDASRSLSPEPIADWEALSNVPRRIRGGRHGRATRTHRGHTADPLRAWRSAGRR